MKIQFIWGAAIALLLLMAVFFIPKVNAEPANGSNERLVVIHDRGSERAVITTSRTLKDVFEETDIVLDKNDIVEPAIDEELVDTSYQVNIYRARPVVIVDGATRQMVMSAYQTPEQIAKHAGITLNDEDIASIELTNDILADGASVKMIIDRAAALRLTLYGQKDTVYTQATTVAGFLKEKNITLGKKDTLSLAQTAAITEGMKLEIWREGKQTVTREEVIAPPVKEIQDVNRTVGYRKVVSAGTPGKKMVTYTIVMKNGKEVSKKAIQTVVIKKATQRVEIVGVKNNYSGSLNQWLTALRGCEAGGDYTRNSGNGYYGAYQFLPATWNTIANRVGRADLVGVLPSSARPADQDMMVVANARASTGGLATQHPGCYAKLGLSQFPPE